MIRLFRAIRKKLIVKNSISRYLLYAAGEIILVVIGILIALSINNWNEDQQDRDEEQSILRQLKKDYQSDLSQLEEKILMRNEALEACNSLLNQIDNPATVDEEKFYQNLADIARDPTFDPIENDIIGTEKLRLIQNDTLARFLSNWSTEIYQVTELEVDFRKFRTERIFPCYIRLGIARNLTNEIWKDGYTPTEALDKKFSYQFNIKPTKKNLSLEKVFNDV